MTLSMEYDQNGTVFAVLACHAWCFGTSNRPISIHCFIRQQSHERRCFQESKYEPKGRTIGCGLCFCRVCLLRSHQSRIRLVASLLGGQNGSEPHFLGNHAIRIRQRCRLVFLQVVPRVVPPIPASAPAPPSAS